MEVLKTLPNTSPMVVMFTPMLIVSHRGPIVERR